MSQSEITAAVTELQELRRMQEDLSAEIDAITDRIKSHMESAAVDTLTAGPFRVDYKTVTSARIDTTALKKALPEIAERFTRTTETRRFTVR